MSRQLVHNSLYRHCTNPVIRGRNVYATRKPHRSRVTPAPLLSFRRSPRGLERLRGSPRDECQRAARGNGPGPRDGPRGKEEGNAALPPKGGRRGQGNRQRAQQPRARKLGRQRRLGERRQLPPILSLSQTLSADRTGTIRTRNVVVRLRRKVAEAWRSDVYDIRATLSMRQPSGTLTFTRTLSGTSVGWWRIWSSYQWPRSASTPSRGVTILVVVALGTTANIEPTLRPSSFPTSSGVGASSTVVL